MNIFRTLSGCALILTSVLPAFPQTSAAVAASAYFAFHSDEETNLNDALLQAGLLRSGKGTDPELFRAGAEASCFSKLAPSSRAGWDEAVDYYAKVISPADWMQRPQYLVRLALAGPAPAPGERDREFLAIAAGMRAAAAPAYRACRWPAQDARNRAWIADIVEQLSRHERDIASGLEALYQQKWDRLPIRVDIVEQAGWARANSTEVAGDGRGHLLISPSFTGTDALEIVFHEASHLIMGREDPVQRAIDDAAAAAALRLPPDTWHVVLFHTTGEVVRRVLAASRPPRAHRPVLHGIYDRGTWTYLRAAVESAWQPYVDGKVDLAAAARNLVAAIPRRRPRPAP